MAYQFLRIEHDENLAVVTLCRPEKRNALSHDVRKEIIACFSDLAEDSATSVVILLTEGPVYCAGFDLSEFGAADPQRVKDQNESSMNYHVTLAEFPKPIVTGIQGPAMGGGFDLAALCDIRIAAPEAKFAHPEIKFGVPVLFGPLKDLVGSGIARDLALTGRAIDAKEAQAIGLVSEIVNGDDLPAACMGKAKMIAEAPARGVLGVKKQIIDSYGGRELLGDGEAFLAPEMAP